MESFHKKYITQVKLENFIRFYKFLKFSQIIYLRHHEKVMVIDDKSIIGSANISDNYASIKYGSNFYMDIN